MNQEAICKENIINNQINNHIKLGDEIKSLGEENARQAAEIQKMAKWKEIYYIHMREYEELKK